MYNSNTCMYNTGMKIAKTFRLEEDVVEILNQQPNATQFIEALIRGDTSSDNIILNKLNELERSLKNASTQKAPDGFVPRPPDPETGYPCCSKRSPCKHWTWDGAEELWVNQLTGKTRNA